MFIFVINAFDAWANGVILLKHFCLLMHCLCISHFHTLDVDALVVKVFSNDVHAVLVDNQFTCI